MRYNKFNKNDTVLYRNITVNTSTMILSDFIENFLYRLLRGVCQNDLVLVIFRSFTPHAKVQDRNRPLLFIYLFLSNLFIKTASYSILDFMELFLF